MDQKQNNEPVSAPAAQKETPKKRSNKTLWWILGGCLGLLVISGLVIGGMVWWGYKKVKKEIKNNRPNFEKIQSELEKSQQQIDNFGAQANPTGQEMPEAVQPGTNHSEEPTSALPDNAERQMGYVKKIYTMSGKYYLEIDYIQWFMGDAAEKAMREDGECPKTGECEVLDDYYIRNANPLIRTFEISPDVVITMQTYDMEATGQIQGQEITIGQFSQIFNNNLKPNLKNVPYIVEIENKLITKINEQYIP
jgi:hypothetical protein